MVTGVQTIHRQIRSSCLLRGLFFLFEIWGAFFVWRCFFHLQCDTVFKTISGQSRKVSIRVCNQRQEREVTWAAIFNEQPMNDWIFLSHSQLWSYHQNIVVIPLCNKPFATLETKRKLGQVNFCKDFWDWKKLANGTSPVTIPEFFACLTWPRFFLNSKVANG